MSLTQKPPTTSVINSIVMTGFEPMRNKSTYYLATSLSRVSATSTTLQESDKVCIGSYSGAFITALGHPH